jgi:predicted ABC-type ATPase
MSKPIILIIRKRWRQVSVVSEKSIIFAANMTKNLYIISGCNGAGKTTLATKSYINLVHRAQAKGYTVRLLFFWLNSPELALQRIAERVSKGGHNIPEPIARRRYVAGIKNLFNLFIPVVDYWAIFDNSETPRKKIAIGGKDADTEILYHELYEIIKAYVK